MEIVNNFTTKENIDRYMVSIGCKSILDKMPENEWNETCGMIYFSSENMYKVNIEFYGFIFVKSIDIFNIV